MWTFNIICPKYILLKKTEGNIQRIPRQIRNNGRPLVIKPGNAYLNADKMTQWISHIGGRLANQRHHYIKKLAMPRQGLKTLTFCKLVRIFHFFVSFW